VKVTCSSSLARPGRGRACDELDISSRQLLIAAIRQLQLTTVEIARLLSVAQSVASLLISHRSTPSIWQRRSNIGRASRPSLMPYQNAEPRLAAGVAPCAWKIKLIVAWAAQAMLDFGQ
jgi:hypothetical protein